MTDHWDHDDFDIDVPEDLPPPAHDILADDIAFDDHDPDPAPTWEDPLPADHDDVPDTPDTATDAAVFPPTVEIGDLPEPVDGFPWIDTATLGAGTEAFTPPTDPVTAEQLAEYAGIEIPPGADPWTVLTNAEDPATAALARWWTPDEQ